MSHPTDDSELTGLDRVVQQAAQQLSRRGFLSGLAKWSAGLGLGVSLAALPKQVEASSCVLRDGCSSQFRTVDGPCGSCTPQNNLPRFNRATQTRVYCPSTPTSGACCGPWTTLGNVCITC